MCSANVRAFASLKGFGCCEGRKDKLYSVWSNPDKSGQPFQKKNHKERLLKWGTKGKAKAPQKRLDSGSWLSYFLIIKGAKCSIILFLIKKNRVRTVQILPETDKGGQKMWNRKTPKNRSFSGFLSIFEPVWTADYLLLNCGARRAALRPYCARFWAVFPWYFGLFRTFRCSVILCGNHGKWLFFNQQRSDEKHRLLHWTTPLAYYTWP